MKEPAFTKGPWRVGIANCVVCDTHDDTTHHKPFELEDYGGALVCESIRTAENARLIAAAPSLYEALQEGLALTLNWVSTAEPEHLQHLSEYRRVIKQIRAALALVAPVDEKPNQINL